MTTGHLFVAKHEPATRYNIGGPSGQRIYVRNKPHRTLPCSACKRWRWAANLVVQVYYDCVRFSCAKGKGCHG